MSVEALLDSAPNPNAPALREAIDAALTSDERTCFLGELTQAFADARAVGRTAAAYVVAAKASRPSPEHSSAKPRTKRRSCGPMIPEGLA